MASDLPCIASAHITQVPDQPYYCWLTLCNNVHIMGIIRLNSSLQLPYYIYLLPVALIQNNLKCMVHSLSWRLSLLNGKRRQQPSNKLPWIPIWFHIFGKKSHRVIMGHCKRIMSTSMARISKYVTWNIQDDLWHARLSILRTKTMLHTDSTPLAYSING